MTNKPENFDRAGGPAFPVSIPGVGDNGWHGMTLRDWFAGQALPGMLRTWPLIDAVVKSYKAADAMLDERERSAPRPRGIHVG